MGFERDHRRVARHSVYDALRSAIVEWEFLPGERLAEPALADLLGVSRTPIREALHRIEAEGLAVRNSGGSLCVAPASVDDAKDLFAVRTALERVTAREAAERTSRDQLDRMERILAAMAVAVELQDRILVTQHGREFHELIQQASGNRVCQTLLEQLRPHVDRYRVLSAASGADRPSEALSDHRAILAALRARDAHLAEELMAKHTAAGEALALRALEGMPHKDRLRLFVQQTMRNNS